MAFFIGYNIKKKSMIIIGDVALQIKRATTYTAAILAHVGRGQSDFIFDHSFWAKTIFSLS